jgi:PAS domain S-box-containing protein
MASAQSNRDDEPVTRGDGSAASAGGNHDAAPETELKLQEWLRKVLDPQSSLLQAVIDNAQVGIAVLDGRDLRARWVNPAYRKFLEGSYRSMELDGVPFSDFVPRAEESGLVELLRRAAATGIPHVDAEYRHEGFDRGVTYWRWSLVPLPQSGQDVPDLMIIAVEITEQVVARKRVEGLARVGLGLNAGQTLPEVMQAALKGACDLLSGEDASIWLLDEEERRLRGAMEIWGGDRTGAVIDLDDWPNHLRAVRDRKLTYLTRPETAGDEGWWFDHLGIWASLIAPLVVGERCLGVMFVNFRLKGHRPSAEEFDFAAALANQCAQAMARARAQEERERLMEEIRKGAAELEGVVENTQAQLALLDRDLNFVLVNTSYVKGCGHSREELIGRNHFSFFPNDENQAIFQRVRDTGEPYEAAEKPFEFVDDRGRGVTYWNWILAPIKDETGQVREVLLSLLDVTPQVRARQQVEEASLQNRELAQRAEQQLEQMTALLRSREDFISLVSHDLRAPLTAVQGHAQMLQRAADRPDVVTRSAEAIYTAARRMNRMIQDLVESAKLETGQMQLERIPVDVASFVIDLKHRMSTVLDTDRVWVEMPEVVHSALADPDRLERILTNLISNALKYSEDRVVVKVEQGDQGIVRVSVIDRGPGISQEELPLLFDRFYRTKDVRKQEGLGLGLYIARMLVEAHGGSIWVESRLEEGTTFTFTLPMA